jgi:hypothetical protein
LVSSFLAAPVSDTASFRVLYEEGTFGYGATIYADGCTPVDLGEDAQFAFEPLFVSKSLGPYQEMDGQSVRDGTNFSFDLVGLTEYHRTVACATTPVAGDIAAIGNRWALAMASGSDLSWSTGNGDCLMTFGGDIGPAQTLTFGRLSHDAMTIDVAATLTTTSPVARVRLAGSANGLWATWVLDDGTFAAAALDASVNPTPLAVEMPPEMELGSSDVHALGSGFVVASATGSGVEVASVSPSGLVNDVVSLPADGPIDGRVFLNANDALDTLLVAWAETDAGGDVVHVARVRCTD